MKTISYLSDDIVASIAAGEVIERPAYVVKELIDNALDAKAKNMWIDISQAGLRRISVLDDGIGMSSEDIVLSVKLHTTSKLATLDDLHHIHSFGFRGEALASIAAVSELTIYSRHESEAIGTQYNVNEDISIPSGMPIGTRVVVEDLFKTVPARKNFLKSIATERRLIVDIVTAYALAHPDIHFVLRSESTVVLDLQPEPLMERYISLYQFANSAELLPLKLHDSYVEIGGYMSKPNRSFASTHEQYLIVNKRPITDRMISSAIKEGYGSLLPRDQYPSGVFIFTIPVQLLDINVHPRKENISFSNPKLLYETIKNAVQETLARHNLTFQTVGWSSSANLSSKKSQSITSSVAGRLLKDRVLDQAQDRQTFKFSTLQQWHETYISIETKTGIFLFDQHAMHERILFEKFVHEFKQQQDKKQLVTLSSPVSLKLTPAQFLLIEEHRELLSQIGFVVEPRTKTTYSLIQVPDLFSDRDPQQILFEFIADIQNGNPIRSLDTLTHKLLTYLACRSAVKAGDKLTKKKMKSLIEELQQTPNKYTCPHGRPTMIEMKKNDLDVLFHRK